MARSKAAEFGGVGGLIAPLPHPLTAAEAARLERAVDPEDPSGSVESQRLLEAGKRGLGTPK